MAFLLTKSPNVYTGAREVPSTIRLVVFGYVYQDPVFYRDGREVTPINYSRRSRDLVTEVTIAWPRGSRSISVLTSEKIAPRIFAYYSASPTELKVEASHLGWTVRPSVETLTDQTQDR